MPTPNNKIDFAIITALPKELTAVLDKLGPCKTLANESESLLFYQGNIGDAKVIVTQSGPGNIKAAHAATVVWERYHPTYLLMVGIGAGFEDAKVQLGDVVVAKSCYYDGSGKETAEGKLPAPDQRSTHSSLFAKSENYRNIDWKASIQVSSPGGGSQPTVHHGVIVSSETVVANKERMVTLLTANRECRALAMEGYGVAVAVHDKVRFLEIRGISDFGDGTKNDEWHDYAADVVAAYAVGLLRHIDEAIHQSFKLHSLIKSLLWFMLTLLAGLSSIWVAIVFSYLFSVPVPWEKLVKEGGVLFFSTVLISSLAIDFYIFREAPRDRFINFLFSRVPFFVNVVSLIIYLACYFESNDYTDLRLNIDLVTTAEAIILLVTAGYATGIKWYQLKSDQC
jgi:nucleoside phosphorylase